MVWIIIRDDAGSVVVTYSSASGERESCVRVRVLSDIAIDSKAWISSSDRNASAIRERDSLIWLIIGDNAGSVIVRNSSAC